MRRINGKPITQFAACLASILCACATGVGRTDGTTAVASDAGPLASNDGASATADAGTITLGDGGATLAVPATLPFGPNDLFTPALLVEPDGKIDLALHRFLLHACMICDADRMLERWDGEEWNLTMQQTSRPGTMAATPAMVWDPTRGGVLLADSDLSDPYHPPMHLHVWLVTPSGPQELGSPLGDRDEPDHPAIAVDSSGVVSVAWIEDWRYPRPAPAALRFARFSSGAWRALPSPSSSDGAKSLSLLLDGQERPTLAWCDQTAAHLSQWDDTAGSWSDAPALPTGDHCAISLAFDARRHPVIAYGTAKGSVTVQSWDGNAWTSLGTDLGPGSPSLVLTSGGTLILATGSGTWEWSGGWTLVEPARENTAPVTLATGHGFVVEALLEYPTESQHAGISFRLFAR